jgi:hypothetical protein
MMFLAPQLPHPTIACSRLALRASGAAVVGFSGLFIIRASFPWMPRERVKRAVRRLFLKKRITIILFINTAFSGDNHEIKMDRSQGEKDPLH